MVIIKFFKPSFSFVRKQRDSALKADMESILNEILPKYLEEMSKSISKHEELLQEIKDLNEQQNEEIIVLSEGLKDIMRQRIMEIYHLYKTKKAMPLPAREKLKELYKDYKRCHGNSYIDKYYSRMETWDTIDED
jgi:hypothetical protein